MTVVETEKHDVAPGIGQCVAQMIGAKVFNANKVSSVKKGSLFSSIYACVTPGAEGQSLKLDDRLLTLDRRTYFIRNVPEILGILQFLIQGHLEKSKFLSLFSCRYKGYGGRLRRPPQLIEVPSRLFQALLII